MPTNKNAFIRYKILDACFRNPGRMYFIDDLIEECNKVLFEMDQDSCGISRRQILYDIAFMESAEGWSIDLDRIRDGKKLYFRYTDPSFSINNMPLNEVEVRQIQSAIEILSHFKGMPQFEWMQELVPKLKQGLSSGDATAPIMDFDTNQYLKGIEHLAPLYNAISYKRVLSINYLPFETKKSSKISLHPYYLKQYNNRWFLFGYNPEMDRNDWNLALDRIVDIKESNQEYRLNEEIDWSEYFEDIIGATKPDHGIVEPITLHFYGRTGKYVETKPLHGSQKIKRIDSQTLEVHLRLMINYELERLILSYADSVKVIQPQIFAVLIRERLETATKLY